MSEQTPKKDRYSYSALSCADQCMLNYYNRYILKHRPPSDTLATELGTCLHKGCELCTTALIEGRKPDYEFIKSAVLEGWTGESKMNNGKEEVVLGVNELKRKYWEDWLTEKSDTPSYDTKLETYFAHLKDEEQDEVWEPIAAELSFEVELEGRNAVLFGIIDRVDRKRSDHHVIRLVDHKSSNNIYGEKKGDNKLVTPLQFYIYTLGASALFPDCEIESCVYNFLMYGEQREAGTKGWKNRAQKKLNKILDDIEKAKSTGIWKPSPTPLCYWCDYCRHNPNANSEFNTACPYFSMWSPTDRKNYAVFSAWEEGTKAEEDAQINNAATFTF